MKKLTNLTIVLFTISLQVYSQNVTFYESSAKNFFSVSKTEDDKLIQIDENESNIVDIPSLIGCKKIIKNKNGDLFFINNYDPTLILSQTSSYLTLYDLFKDPRFSYVYSLEDGKIVPYINNIGDIVPTDVKDVEIDDKGSLWILTPSSLYQMIDNILVKQTDFGMAMLGNPNYQYYDLFFDTNHYTWAIGSKITLGDGDGWKEFKPRDGLIKFGFASFVHNYLVTETGVFFGMMGGINYYTNGEFLAFNKKDGIAKADYWILFQDNQNNVWAKKGNELSKYDGGGWENFNKKNSPLEAIVDVSEYNKQIYVATKNGIYVYDYKKWSKLPNDIPDIMDLNASDKGLYATTETGIEIINGNDSNLIEGQFTFLTFDLFGNPVFLKQENNDIYLTSIDTNKKIKFFRFDGKKDKYNSQILTTGVDSDNNLWIGFTTKLAKIDLSSL